MSGFEFSRVNDRVKSLRRAKELAKERVVATESLYQKALVGLVGLEDVRRKLDECIEFYQVVVDSGLSDMFSDSEERTPQDMIELCKESYKRINSRIGDRQKLIEEIRLNLEILRIDLDGINKVIVGVLKEEIQNYNKFKNTS